MLVPLGVSLKFKTLDNIFNGITLSIYGLFLLTYGLSLALISTKYEFIIKLSAFVCVLTALKTHKDLKNKIQDFLGMTEAIEDFESKRCPNNTPFGYSISIFLLSLMMTYLSTVIMVVMSPLQDQIFNGFENFHVQVYFSHHATLTLSIPAYHLYVIQFLLFEFWIHYNNVLNYSNNFIERYLSYRPDVKICLMIDKVIEDFQENDIQYEKILAPMKRTICVLVISANFQLICEFVFMVNNFDSMMLGPIFIWFFIDFYFILTQIIIFNKSKSQKILLKTIEKWKNLAENGHKLRGSLISKPFIVETIL